MEPKFDWSRIIAILTVIATIGASIAMYAEAIVPGAAWWILTVTALIQAFVGRVQGAPK